MAQQEVTEWDSYNTYGGDRVFTFGEIVAFVYADQSPQFIRCDSEAEAKTLFETTRAQAYDRGDLREVEGTK